MHPLPMSQLIFSLKIIYTLIAILLFNTNCNAQVKISVDSAFRHIFSSEKLTLPRGEITSIDLHSNKFGDHYEFRYTTTAPIKILLIKHRRRKPNAELSTKPNTGRLRSKDNSSARKRSVRGNHSKK